MPVSTIAENPQGESREERGPTVTDEAMSARTLVQLQGGHSTVVSGLVPGDLESIIVRARENQIPFVYLQDYASVGVTPNRVCVDPLAVVALIRVDR